MQRSKKTIGPTIDGFSLRVRGLN